MAWLFSKRCKQALKDDKIKVTIPFSVRFRIFKSLQKHDIECSDGWHNSSIVYELLEHLKSELGQNDFYAYSEDTDGKLIPCQIEGFILRGNRPPFIFDALELFYSDIGKDRQHDFQNDLNVIFEESELPWRMANGKIFPMDSAYLEQEIISRAYELLDEANFEGALKEFEKSRVDLINGDAEGAIHNANLAVESTMKGILGIQKAKPGELYKKIIELGIIPEYYQGFLKCFEENILRSVAIIRNQEPGAGHGQGAKINVVPIALAELSVHLAAVIIRFLIKQKLSVKKSPSKDIAPENAQPIDEIPF